MVDSAEATTPKKAKAAKPKKPKTSPSHPKVSEMVNAAISNLKERGGSSLAAIKKYIATTYKVDIQKLSPFIRKYLRNAVEQGGLVQTKGKGASGSFRIGGASAPAKEKKSAAKPKKTAAVKSPKPKKAKASPKKAAKPKKSAEKKPKKAATPKKAKPAKKPPAKKSKSPKAAKKPKAAPKKAAAKKGKK